MRDHLLFRDYLRAHSDTVRAYAALKHELARRNADDRMAYQAAKSSFVEMVTRRAAGSLADRSIGEHQPGSA